MASQEVCNLIDQYVLRLLRESGPDHTAWNMEKIRQGAPASWNYVDGCMMTALLSLHQITGDARYFDFVDSFIDSFIGEADAADHPSSPPLAGVFLFGEKQAFTFLQPAGASSVRSPGGVVYAMRLLRFAAVCAQACASATKVMLWLAHQVSVVPPAGA